MPIYLRQSTASQEVPLGYFVDSTDGNTEETGLTIANTDIKVWKTGATTLANKNSGGATHISNGVYYAVMDATDTDTIGPLVIFVHVSGALTVRLECCVLDEAVYDALFGTVALATATNITAGTVTTATNVTTVNGLASGVITATSIAADAITAAKIADGAIDAGAIAADAITAAKIATGAIDADALASDAVTEIRSLASGTSDSGSTTTMVDSARTEADTDYWKGAFILFTSGNISGQCRLITAFDAATDTITFAPATTQAVSTQTYEILPSGRVDLQLWLGSVANALISGRVDSNTQAMANNVITASVIATDAIDADAIADNAINAGAIAADAITAAKIATGAIDADAIAADAVTEIQAGLATQASVDTIDNFLDTEIGSPSDFGSGASLAKNFVDIEALVDDIESRIGTPAGASLSADIAAIEAQTDDIGVAGAGLTALPWNSSWDAEVQSEVDDAIVARFLDKLVTVSGTADSGSTTTMVDAARTEADNDYWKGAFILFTSGNISGQMRIITDFVAATDTFTFAPPLTQAVSTQTYVILPGLSIWDDTLAEHLISGSTGAALNAAGSAGDPWNTALPGAYGAGTAGKIIGDNVNATISSRASQASLDTLDDYVDTEVAAIKAKTDNLPSDPADASDIASSFTTVNGKLDTIDDFLDTEVAAIKAKTDNLPSDPADASDIASSFTTVNGKLDTIDDFLDTEIAAIKAKTDNLPADPADESNVLAAIAGVQADTDNIQTRLPAALVGGRIDASVGAMASNVLTAAALASDAVNEIADGLLDRADAIETGLTLRGVLRLIGAACAGIASGLATATAVYRNAVQDSKARITATVDADGNRSAITWDVS